MDIKEENILGDEVSRHWYYVCKGRALRSFLGRQAIKSVLDVGAGSGFFSKFLLQSGGVESAVCVDTGYSEDRLEWWADKPIEYQRSIETSTADVALFMDVLEHVDDDAELLREYARKLPAGANILITVPAFQFLFSGHDLFLEHRRRYSVRRLEEAVRIAGLEVIKSRYFFGFLLPIVMLQRLANKFFVSRGHTKPRSALKKHSPVTNMILTLIHELELVFFPAEPCRWSDDFLPRTNTRHNT